MIDNDDLEDHEGDLVANRDDGQRYQVCSRDDCDNRVVVEDMDRGRQDVNKTRCIRHKLHTVYNEGDELPVEIVPGGSYRRDVFEGAVKLCITETNCDRDEREKGRGRYTFDLLNNEGDLVTTHFITAARMAVNVNDNGVYTIAVNWDGSQKAYPDANGGGRDD